MTDEVFFPPYRQRARLWVSRSLRPIRRIGRTKAASDPESMANARTAAIVMLIAFAVFALFESEGIRHFTRDLPGNAFTDVLVRGADQWHALMERLGAFTDVLVRGADQWHALMERLGPARVQPAVRHGFEWLTHVRW